MLAENLSQKQKQVEGIAAEESDDVEEDGEELFEEKTNLLYFLDENNQSIPPSKLDALLDQGTYPKQRLVFLRLSITCSKCNQTCLIWFFLRVHLAFLGGGAKIAKTLEFGAC